jgi:hypothetical protein
MTVESIFSMNKATATISGTVRFTGMERWTFGKETWTFGKLSAHQSL